MSDRLTPHPLQALIDATPPGMAHWAGTGPTGATCRECSFWVRQGNPRHKRDEAGLLQPRRCKKYTALNHGEQMLTGVPASTPACRYFQRHYDPPPLVREKKRRLAIAAKETLA